MADTITLNSGSGGASLATQDESGVHYQEVKLTASGNGTTEALSKAEDSAHSGGEHGIMSLAVRRDADTALVGTDGDYAPLQVNAAGALKVEIFDGGDSHTIDGTVTANLGATDNAVLDAIQTAVELIDNAISGSEMQVDIVSSAAIPVTDNSGSLTVDNAALSVTGGGVEASALRVTIASDSTGVLSVDDNGGSLTIDNANLTTIAGAVSGTEMQVDVVAALPAGTNAIGKLAANSGVDIGDVDVTSISAGSNLVGDVGIQGRATGGLTIFRSIDIDESEEEVKATAGTVYAINAFNSTAAPLFLKFYNLTAANTTVGSSTPVLTFLVPANADSDGAGFIFNVPQGIEFDTAITVAATTAVADGDTGAPGANACMVHVFYA